MYLKSCNIAWSTTNFTIIKLTAKLLNIEVSQPVHFCYLDQEMIEHSHIYFALEESQRKIKNAIFCLNFSLMIFTYILQTERQNVIHVPSINMHGVCLKHPGLAEIPAPVGSQDVMSQLRDYPSRQ